MRGWAAATRSARNAVRLRSNRQFGWQQMQQKGQTMDLKQHLIRQMAFSQATAAVEIHKALFAAKKVKV